MTYRCFIALIWSGFPANKRRKIVLTPDYINCSLACATSARAWRSLQKYHRQGPAQWQIAKDKELWQLRREQIWLCPRPPRDLSEPHRVVASQYRVRGAGGLPDLIVCNGISPEVDDFD